METSITQQVAKSPRPVGTALRVGQGMWGQVASPAHPARLVSSRPLPGAAASSGRCQAASSRVAAWRAGRASLLGSCLLTPHPSGK